MIRESAIMVLLLATGAGAIDRKTEEALRPLYDAIRYKESKNAPHPRKGDDGLSRGPYQIKYIYWKDSQTRGHYSDCDKKQYAEVVMYNYWYKYCRQALRENDYEVLSRVHNGGPFGARKGSTLPYWRDIKSILSRRQVR